jgi:hypothetical protein
MLAAASFLGLFVFVYLSCRGALAWWLFCIIGILVFNKFSGLKFGILQAITVLFFD